MAYIGQEPFAAVLTSSDLADNIITSAKIADGTVIAADILDSSITTAKIANGNVTAAKLGTVFAANITGLGALATLSNVPVANITGTLAVSQGGTGLTAPGTSGNVLVSNGTIWTSAAASGGFGARGEVLTGSQTLTSASPGAIGISFTADYQSVTLPNATTLSEAAVLYNITNISSFTGVLRNASGDILGFMPGGSDIIIGLIDNTTSAGTWAVNGQQPVGVTAALGSSLGLSGTPLILNLGGGRYLLYTEGSTMVVYDSINNTIGSSYTPPFSNGDITVLDTDKLLIAYPASDTNPSSMKVRVLTISGTTITAQTEATTSNTFAGQANSGCFIVSLSTTLAILAYYDANFGNSQGFIRHHAISISGNTCTVGNPASVDLGNFSNLTDIVRVSNTSFITYTMRGGQYGGYTGATVSGTTITLGSRTDNTGGGGFSNELFDTSTRVGKKNMFITLGNGTIVYVDRGASGQGTFTRVFALSLTGTTVNEGTVTLSTDTNAERMAFLPLTSNTFLVAWAFPTNGAVSLTHITNSSGTTLSKGTDITVLPSVSSPLSPIFIRSNPNGSYSALRAGGNPFVYTLSNFTLSGVNPVLTNTRTLSEGRLVGQSVGATGAIAGFASSSTKVNLLTRGGSLESDLNFTTFREVTTALGSFLDTNTRVRTAGTRFVYVNAAGGISVIEVAI